MKRELICISCPIGCVLNVCDDENGDLIVTGNACKRGEVYGKKEVTAPTRTVTSTILVKNGKSPLVSVRTERDIPKDKIFDCMAEIRKTVAAAPVKIGDVLIADTAETGVAVVATSEAQRTDGDRTV
jgi:Uncharacterized protein with conserved CXXC pairs